MATLYTVLCAIQAQISAVTQGLISNSPDTFGLPLTVRVGLYWPSAKSLQDNVRKNNANGTGPTSLITVYDRGLAADSTRWSPTVVSQTIIPATMTVTLSEGFVQQLETMTMTFGDPVSVGDAVAVVLTANPTNPLAVIATAVAGDDAASMAAKVAALLNADPVISTWLIAVAVGPVVTLTSIQASAFFAIQANVGNGGTQMVEVGRRKRHFQIVVWSRTPDDRITVSDPIEALIASLESDFGLTFPDGTMGQLTFSGDTMHDEATLSDTMRRDFMVCVDYGINRVDQLYSVLAPIAQTTNF